MEELLELVVPMKGKTRDEVFLQLVTILNKFELLWEKMFGFLSYGAQTMIGKSNGVAEKF
jgi:hypothetical protein